MDINKYRKLNIIFWIISSLLMIGMVILYAHLLQAYKSYALYILFIFAVILIGIIYLYDWSYHFMENKVIGQKIKVVEHHHVPRLPQIISINQYIKRTKQSFYKHDGYKIPEAFIKRIRGAKGYLYPLANYDNVKDEVFEVMVNFRYHYFLVKDQLGAYYIVHRNQIR